MMDYGAHLPLLDFGEGSATLDDLRAYTRTAVDLEFTHLCVNDHLVFQRPWLDGPTALAAVLADSGTLSLMTTVALPVVRGPVPLAKTAAALDRLSGGRLILGVGPGSSARDYDAVGVPFEERWPRLEEAIQALRGLLSETAPRFAGTWYTSEPALTPAPLQPTGPPIWIGSWGSAAGLRRVARLADGWLASGYTTTPEIFGEARARLAERLGQPDFPNAVATLWFYVTTDSSAGEAVLGAMAEMLNRPPDDLRAQLPIGTPDQCAAVLRRYAKAGAHRVFLWPVRDPVRQLEAFADRVRPLVNSASD